MRRLLAFSLCCFFTAALTAQQNYASISFGTSLPFGDYAASGQIENNGYARPGAAIKFDAGYFPVSYFGIGGSFSFGSSYPMQDRLQEDLMSYVAEHAESMTEIPSDAEVVFDAGFWNYIGLSIGPQFSIRINQRLYVDLRALPGLYIVRPPDMELHVSYNNRNIYTSASENGIAFGLSAGTGVRYKLSEAIALRLGADYTMSRSRSDYSLGLFSGVAEGLADLETDIPISCVEITAGLAYAF